VRSVSGIGGSARASALADAGVNLAVLDLVAVRQQPGRPRRFPIDGTPTVCAPEPGTSIALAVRDEGGRVDLNTADERLLKALFLAAGTDEARAAALADAVIDFRDADGTRRPRGAEAADYIAAGRAAIAKNAPFDAVEELGQVLGIDSALMQRLAPLVTVHSGLSGIDPAAAPAVLRAGVPADLAASSPKRIFLVRADALTETGVRFVREAVVEINAGRTTTWTFKRWRRVSADADMTPPAPNLPPC
jgi:general secretion pathway protein K